MLEWVLSLLVALGVAGGGVQGVTTAQGHQAGGATPMQANAQAIEQANAQDAAQRLSDLIDAILAKLATAAEHADSHAQDALVHAGEAASAGLTKAADAIAEHRPGADAAADAAADAGADAAADHPTGAPFDVSPAVDAERPGPGDHPGN